MDSEDAWLLLIGWKSFGVGISCTVVLYLNLSGWASEFKSMK